MKTYCGFYWLMGYVLGMVMGMVLAQPARAEWIYGDEPTRLKVGPKGTCLYAEDAARPEWRVCPDLGVLYEYLENCAVAPNPPDGEPLTAETLEIRIVPPAQKIREKAELELKVAAHMEKCQKLHEKLMAWYSEVID